MKDYLIRGTDELGRIRVLVATSTNMVEKARQKHNTSPTATAALGRSLTAGVLMGAMMKNEKDVLTIKIAGDGPAGNIYIVAKNNGIVKGYISNPGADLPSRSDGKLDVGGLVGKNGNITTMMDLGLKEPYIGQSNLVTGEIAEDLANYYMYSEQQPSAVSLGVLVDKDISVRAAGGYIIQLLPGISDEEIDKVEKSLSKIKPVSTMIDEGMTPEEVLREILGDFNIKILDKISIDFQCDCSRNKIEKVLMSLGKKELNDIIEEDEKAEVVCHFCNTKYQFNKEELINLIVDI
ncbi:Hsp33 family molecular chaperone HslO [Wansuia hejianensis]|uniref:33 kDa chaperonin n=1 Tax=Wansuia hejianensis TaxID=2763667 RepID=A0A926F1E5_9FIRM|nr:Hsp33 family molecular chaperone HslO [Wansuia hejianensis]MBC8591287.1 Hsp33 family molecular chaperone HslO [Wansuia hejianensis]